MMLPMPTRRTTPPGGPALSPARRQFLQLATGSAASALFHTVRADTYPARAARVLVGFGAGVTPDITARLMAQWLSDKLSQQFIVENRPGAGGNIATQAVVKATPDGYELLLITLANAVNTSLYDHLDFDFIRDIAPVASLVRSPLVMEVSPSLPVKTVPEFIAYARANAGRISMATGGNGTPQHVAGELFRMLTGVAILPVPYSGNPMPDVLDGRVQVYFGPIPSSIAYIRSGKLRPLAVTGATRSEALPDVATLGEFVPGYQAGSWYGIGAPAATPREIVEKLNREINAGLSDPQMKSRLRDLGAEPAPMSSAEFGQFIAAETAKWAKVVKFSGMKPQ
jgi:tripartite-type tricarboxylate transporter receptor subunit TctC